MSNPALLKLLEGLPRKEVKQVPIVDRNWRIRQKPKRHSINLFGLGHKGLGKTVKSGREEYVMPIVNKAIEKGTKVPRLKLVARKVQNAPALETNAWKRTRRVT